MILKNVSSPQELLKFLDDNLTYGVVDKKGNKIFDSNLDEFQEACNNDWILQSPQQILDSGVGHCYDQVEVERAWFAQKGYNFFTFWISAYQPEIENSGFSHTYLVFEDNNKWYLFEHADASFRGIYEFDNIKDAVKFQADHQVDYAKQIVQPKSGYSVCIKQFDKPQVNINMQQYLQHIDASKDYNI